MKMHDLGEKPGSMGLSLPKKNPEPYYPSVTIEDAEDLSEHEIGKKLSFHATGVIDSHEERKTPDGTKLRTSIKLHAIGVAGDVKEDGADRMRCTKCGRLGKGPYCTNCGEKMKAMKKGAA